MRARDSSTKDTGSSLLYIYIIIHIYTYIHYYTYIYRERVLGSFDLCQQQLSRILHSLFTFHSQNHQSLLLVSLPVALKVMKYHLKKYGNDQVIIEVLNHLYTPSPPNPMDLVVCYSLHCSQKVLYLWN